MSLLYILIYTFVTSIRSKYVTCRIQHKGSLIYLGWISDLFFLTLCFQVIVTVPVPMCLAIQACYIIIKKQISEDSQPYATGDNVILPKKN